MRTATALTAALLPALLCAALASALPAVEHINEIHAPPGVPADHTGAAVNLKVRPPDHIRVLSVCGAVLISNV